ncbi:MAG: autotransporter-associated beta strand repeat-containing protein [Prevotella sp.]|nr:autotransporter-associated beta strand repeat-containing protein [Prevotella sp.]
MKKFLMLAMVAMMTFTTAFAQRSTEQLDRGLVAVKTDAGVFCSWRIYGEEYYDVKYNLYRDGVKLNAEPLNVSNYVDAGGTVQSTYTVAAVVRGQEQSQSAAVQTWAQAYLEITPNHGSLTSTFVPNDACCADVDGDGELEILIKFDNASWAGTSYQKAGYNGEYFIMECYKLNGQKLWWIDFGPNMADFQNNEQNIVAYDWDGDGKAEALMRASDGTVIHAADGTEYVIGDASKNYLASTNTGQWFIHEGNEFLVYLNGSTGQPYQIMDYPLKRLEDGETDLSKAWGDGYGHRSTKHFFGAPYLDGRHPSIFLARGIYTRHKMVAFDVNPQTHELTERWRWNCNDASSPWYGNGYHNYAVADVDWDGRDEICFGSMVIDDNGHGLSTTGLGHGDAQHHSDFNPYVHGHEIYACNEDQPSNNYRDATTSKIYYRKAGGSDDGRCMAGNFSNDIPGAMGFSSHDDPISCVTNDHVTGLTKSGLADNMRIYWDGDLLEECFNYTNGKNTAGGIYKYGKGLIKTLTGSQTNNDTKGTPSYQGDLFGDWREEVMMRTHDNTIRIYTTTDVTPWRNYTLWHDMQYRQAMVWQMCGYNQPPHASYFLGELEGITAAPPALTMTNRTEVANGGAIGTALNDQQVLMAETRDMTVSVADGASPYVFFDNAPSWVQGHDDNDDITTEYFTHTLTGGAFSGDMRLVKQGDGVFVMPAVKQTYTGPTDVWAGTLVFDGIMEQSRVWLNRFAVLTTDGGQFMKGIQMDYASILRPGGADKAGTMEADSLILNFGARVELDVYADQTADCLKVRVLKLEKKDWQNGPQYNAPVIQIIPHYAQGETALPEGRYLLAEVSVINGDIADIAVEGVGAQKASLVVEDGKLYLDVVGLREATDIVWDGGADGVWDFANTENFKSLSGESYVFVSGDNVTFNDDASATTINVTGELTPGSVTFNNNAKDFTLTGSGSIVGDASLTKRGQGTVTINNVNMFTGGTTIESGTITVASLANADGAENGSLGNINSRIKLNGGTLSLANDMTSSHTIIVGQEGGTVHVPRGTFTQNGAVERIGVNAKGALHKTGSGTLNLGTGNKFAALYVDGGSVNIHEKSNLMSTPDTIVFNGQNVTVSDENNSYTYSKNTANFKVTEGSSGRLYLDGRCDYSGTLSGKGTLTVFATYVRNYLNGNWSAFEGTLVANHSGDSYEFSWNNSYGLPKATLNVPSGTTFTCSKSLLTLGSLSGSGVINMTGNLSVGGINDNITFNGEFGNKVNVFKDGTGTWTFSKVVPANEYTFRNGTVQLNNTKSTTSLFGSAVATVQDGACMTGIGTVGNLRLYNGGILQPGNYSAARRYGAITSTGFIRLNQGTKLNLIIYGNTNNQYARSYLVVGGELQLSGELNIELGSEYIPADGDEIILWTAKTFSGTPEVINLPQLPDGLCWDTTDLLAKEGKLRVTTNTAIRGLASDAAAPAAIYNTRGMRVSHPQQSGVYVVNGKKVYIRVK